MADETQPGPSTDASRIPTDYGLTEQDHKLIEQLRKEAHDLKDCFARYSFQALGLSAIALSLIARYQADFPYVAAVSLMVIALLLAVARLGTFKYGSANRHNGYELHLMRTRFSRSSAPEGWQPEMRTIGWEEAMRAWRVVQATTFENLYSVVRNLPNVLRSKHKRIEYKWFAPSELVVDGTAWHSGSYLRTMLGVVHVVAIGSIAPLAAMVVQLYTRSEAGKAAAWEYMVALAGTILVALIVMLRIWQNEARRHILETGLLSIHSCAIMWQAIVVAHYRALRAVEVAQRRAGSKPCGYVGYTTALSEEAKLLNRNIEKIHEYIERPDEFERAVRSGSSVGH